MQCAFKIGETDIGIHNQTFCLMEHRGVSLVVVITVNAARRNNADWRLFIFHGTDLHAGSLCTQQAFGIKPEGIVISTCRMVRRNIQRIKVMIVIFNFRAGFNRKAQFAEKGFDTLNGTGDRMQTAIFHAASRQRDINPLFSQTGIQRRRFQGIFTGIQCSLNLLFGFVNHCTRSRTIFRRQIPQRLHL